MLFGGACPRGWLPRGADDGYPGPPGSRCSSRHTTNTGDRHLRGEKHAATEPVPCSRPVADRSRPLGLRNRLP